MINCNQDLADVFGCGIGEEKLEFHQAVFRLKDHLTDMPPIELAFDVNVSGKQGGPADVTVYELPVFEHGGHHKEQIDFLVNCDYDFFNTPSHDDTTHTDRPSKMSVNGAILKRRE